MLPGEDHILLKGGHALLTPASAFRHPVSQSGTGTFRYRTVLLFRYRTGSSIGIFDHSRPLKTLSIGKKVFMQPARDGLGYILHVNTAGGGKGYTLHVHTAGGGKGYTSIEN
jgi:hypothetical protein